MAAILERDPETRDKNSYKYVSQQEADKVHNALINIRYARLINPDNKLSDLRPEAEPAQYYATVQEEVRRPAAPVFNQAVETNTYYAKPFFVESARTDADLFRADSYINKKEEAKAESVIVDEQSEVEDEDNEDLRPTPTTIQYKTAEVAKRPVQEGAVVSTKPAKHFSLSKRDKIAIVAVVAVIVTLFALIIINSALIAGLNRDVNYLENSLKVAKNSYQQVNDELNEYTEDLEETVKELAESLGMYR